MRIVTCARNYQSGRLKSVWKIRKDMSPSVDITDNNKLTIKNDLVEEIRRVAGLVRKV